MKSGKSKNIEVEKPEIEVSIRVDGEELAVCSFFSAGANEWDVLVGISSPNEREPIALALDAAAAAVRAAAFAPIGFADHERGDNAPF